MAFFVYSRGESVTGERHGQIRSCGPRDRHLQSGSWLRLQRVASGPCAEGSARLHPVLCGPMTRHKREVATTLISSSSSDYGSDDAISISLRNVKYPLFSRRTRTFAQSAFRAVVLPIT